MFAKFVKATAVLAVLIGSLALAGCSVSVDGGYYPYHHHYYRGHYYYYD